MPALPILLDGFSEAYKIYIGSATELTKQLITITVGLLGLSIGFLKDIVKGLPKKRMWIIKIFWLWMFLSLCTGILHLMAITGQITNAISIEAKPEVAPNIRFFAGAQILLFLLGIIFLILFGWDALKQMNEQRTLIAPKAEENNTPVT
jgi:hypothetical protein